MAQKTENEETEFKVVPEALTLCVNNCGFTGNPATNNMCQKCFNATATATAEILKISGAESPRSSSSSADRPDPAPFDLPPVEIRPDPVPDQLASPAPAPLPARREVNRCSGCRRKVGLTGFRCRCGELFCGEHRYSDRHDCSYDYKTVGREAISRENPLVRASKIVKV